MGHYIFPGYPAFLDGAAAELGLPSHAAGGGPPAALAAIANLCAQAATAEPGHVGQILGEAAAIRDRMLVASRAADLMLSEVARAREATDPEPSPRAEPADEPARNRPGRPASRPTPTRP